MSSSARAIGTPLATTTAVSGQGNVTAVPEPSPSLGERVREPFPELAGVGIGHLDRCTDVGGCRDAGGEERIQVRLADADAALYDSYRGRFLSTYQVLRSEGSAGADRRLHRP